MRSTLDKMRQRILVVFISIWHCMFSLETTINPYSRGHPIGGSFEELVERNLYADKTNFIKDLLHEEENIAKISLITYPRRFGKSVNIDMLSTYFQLPLDNAGKITTNNKAHLFERLNIDSDEMLKKNFQGQYPVMKISLGAVSGESFAKMKESFIGIVLRDPYSGVYRQYDFMLDVLINKMGNKNLNSRERSRLNSTYHAFNKLLTAPIHEITDYNLESSFRLLAGMLHEEYGKPVFIFIDEYDYSINDAFLKFKSADRDSILSFFRSLFWLTFRQNPAYLKLSVITGVLRIAKDDLFTSLGNVAEYNILTNQFFRYYGFLEKDVDYLIEKRGNIPTQSVDLVERYFDGYRTSDDLETSIYNPWAISLFLQHRDIGPYYEKSGSLSIFHPVFSHPIIWSDMVNCINGESVMAKLGYLSMTSKELLKLNAMKNPQYVVTENDRFTFYKLLLSTGYLTLDPKMNAGKTPAELGTFAFLRVPNRLMKMELSNILEENRPEGKVSYDVACAKAAGDIENMFFAKNISESVKNFGISFKQILDEHRPFTLKKPFNVSNANEKVIYFNEAVIHSIVNDLGLSINSNYIAMEISPNRGVGKSGADLIIFCTKSWRVLVIEFKIYRHPAARKKAGLSNYAKEAVKQAKTYKRLFQNTVYKIQQVRYVGVAVSVDKIIVIETAEEDVH